MRKKIEFLFTAFVFLYICTGAITGILLGVVRHWGAIEVAFSGLVGAFFWLPVWIAYSIVF